AKATEPGEPVEAAEAVEPAEVAAAVEKAKSRKSKTAEPEANNEEPVSNDEAISILIDEVIALRAELIKVRSVPANARWDLQQDGSYVLKIPAPVVAPEPVEDREEIAKRRDEAQQRYLEGLRQQQEANVAAMHDGLPSGQFRDPFGTIRDK